MNICENDQKETEQCNQDPLWSEWSSCSKTCDGIRTRTDECKNDQKQTEPCSCTCPAVTPTVTSTTTSTTTTKPAAKKAVLMLSTKDSTTVPMVIGYDGKRLQVFFILAQNIFKVKLTMIYALHMKTILKFLAHVQRL